MQKEQERTCRSKLRGRETCLTSFVYGREQQPQQKVSEENTLLNRNWKDTLFFSVQFSCSVVSDSL